MNRRDPRGACVLLATLWAAVGAQAQEVHKCTVNGQVTYQAKPCPSTDVMLPTAPTPSEQELRDASTDLNRQRMQAASGRLYQPPRPSPPPPPPPPSSDTSTTTVIVLPSNAGGAMIIRQTRRSASNGSGSTPPPPANNCEKLNRDIVEAVERRDQLLAPSELAARTQTLAKAQADVARIRDLAQASNCRLAH